MPCSSPNTRCPGSPGRPRAPNSNLRCFAEPGDPYASPLNYLLAHGDEVTCLDFKDFAGQTWVMHEVDERLRGLTKDGAPPAAGTYLAWSYMDFQGARWLVPEGDDEEF